MIVAIINKKNFEIESVMEWKKGRLDSRRFKMIINEMFRTASYRGIDGENLKARFDISDDTIETKTVHGYEYSTIICKVYVNGEYYRSMYIAN